MDKNEFFKDKSRIFVVDKIADMKKYSQKEDKNTVNEPMFVYGYSHSDDRGIYSIIDKINRGVSFSSFENIIKKYHFTLQNWADFLHISTKTLSRYQKEDKSFDALQSERILQIEILQQKGAEVFGNQENFSIWLETENLALGKRVPRSLMNNSFGIQLLMDELTRIEHGVLA